MTAADELLLDTPATRPCTHRRVYHEHGTIGRYNSDRCRCRPCAEAKSTYVRGRARSIAYGRWQAFADPGEARAHVKHLMRAGLSWKTVAERAGLSEPTVHALLYGREDRPVRRIRAETERKLLAVQAGRRRMPQPPDLLTTEASA